MSKQYMEFLEYVNVDFKEKTLKETAFIAKQGEELAKQEFFSRIQPIIDRLSLTYSRNLDILLKIIWMNYIWLLIRR